MHCKARQRCDGSALSAMQYWQAQQMPGDQGRGGVAGKPQQRGAGGRGLADIAQGEGLAGLHRHAAEADTTKALEAGPDVVFLTHRDAAGTDDQIGLAGGEGQRFFQRRGAVADVAKVHKLGVVILQQGVQHAGIRVVDLARGQRFARRDQLRAGTDDSNAHPTPAGHLGDALGRQQRQADGIEGLTRREQRRSLGQLFATPPDMVSQVQVSGKVDLAGVIDPYPFLGHHHVGTAGNRRAGENARTAVKGQGDRGGAGGHPGHHRQGKPVLEVGQTQGVAVHGAVVDTGDVVECLEWRGQDAAAGVGRPQRLDVLQRAGQGDNLLAGLTGIGQGVAPGRCVTAADLAHGVTSSASRRAVVPVSVAAW